MKNELQKQIEEIRELSNKVVPEENENFYYSEGERCDRAYGEGCFQTAKEAILIIDELLKENEKLKQENKEGFALLDRSMTGWQESQKFTMRLGVDIVNLRDEIDLIVKALRYYARSSDPELAKETLIKLNASL
jgi:hypothetical protein